MKQIPLTQGKFALVDNEDFDRVNQFKWKADWNQNGRCFYAGRTDYSVNPRFYVSMARFITNFPEGLLVDHKNHDTLDNQKNNLRACTHTQNRRNSKSQKGASSKYKGVSWNKKNKKWYARIRAEDCFGQSFLKYLGSFADEIEAAKVYDAAANYYHEDFAHLNFPLVKDTHETI